jgi:ABC-type glutathione transport system ATPase component
MLVIEHDMLLVKTISNRMLALDLGSIIAEGAPDEVTNDARVVTSYLGGDISVIQRSGAVAGRADGKRGNGARRKPAARRRPSARSAGS